MSSSFSADGPQDDGGCGQLDRLCRMSDRTALMVIDASLHAASRMEDGTGHAEAAADVRALARRMLQATRDLAATAGAG